MQMKRPFLRLLPLTGLPSWRKEPGLLLSCVSGVSPLPGGLPQANLSTQEAPHLVSFPHSKGLEVPLNLPQRLHLGVDRKPQNYSLQTVRDYQIQVHYFKDEKTEDKERESC